MTFEELKVEAEAQGYKLIKKQEPVRFLPCICGNNRRTLWYGSDGKVGYDCNKCGFEGNPGKSQREAKIGWNEAIKYAVKCAERSD